MVTRRAFSVAVAVMGLSPPGWPQKKKAQRKPHIEILKISCVRQEGIIQYEGDLKVTGEKPVAGLVIQLEFFETRGVLLSMQKIQLEDNVLNPGEEKHFSVQGKDVPRAVSFRLSTTDASGRDLNTAGAGPYPLD